MYCLVMFYHELRGPLQPLKPLGKFLVVKAVVFFSFWQGVIISGLASFGVLHPTLTYSEDDVAKGLQDFLICIEMAFAAIAHQYFFSYRDFYRPEMLHIHAGNSADGKTPVIVHHGMTRALREMLPADVVADAGRHVARGFGFRTATSRSVLAAPPPPEMEPAVGVSMSPLLPHRAAATGEPSPSSDVRTWPTPATSGPGGAAADAPSAPSSPGKRPLPPGPAPSTLSLGRA